MESQTNDHLISSKHRVSTWTAINLTLECNKASWVTATSILKDRICSRFLKPANDLIVLSEDNPAKKEEQALEAPYGFAILALDFLVAETIQGFREGEVDHTGKSTKLCTSFFQRLPMENDGGLINAALAKTLYSQGRCALHHAEQTDNIIIRKGDRFPLLSQSGNTIELNRSKFHNAVKSEFIAYLTELTESNVSELRQNFITKMNALCGVMGTG